MNNKFAISEDEIAIFTRWFDNYAPYINRRVRNIHNINSVFPILSAGNNFVTEDNIFFLNDYYEEEHWQHAWTALLNDRRLSNSHRSLGIEIDRVGEVIGVTPNFTFNGLLMLFYYYFICQFNITNIQNVKNFPYIIDDNFVEAGNIINGDNILLIGERFFGSRYRAIIQRYLRERFKGEFSFLQMFADDHLNMSLYYLFILFFHRILFFTYHKNEIFSVNPYTYWLNPYLAFIQNLNMSLYKKIIDKNITINTNNNSRIKKISNNNQCSIIFPEEMGNLFYWNVEFNNTAFIFSENLDDPNKNMFGNNNWKNENEMFGLLENELKSGNVNLMMTLVSYISKIVKWNRDNNIDGNDRKTIQIVFNVFSLLKLNEFDIQNPNFNGKYIEMSVSIPLNELNQLIPNSTRALSNLVKKTIADFILYKMTKAILKMIDTYNLEIVEEIIGNREITTNFGSLQQSNNLQCDININNYFKNISIRSIKYWSFRRYSDRALKNLENNLKAYDGLNSFICDIFIPNRKTNCIYEVIKFILKKEQIIDIFYNEYEIIMTIHKILKIDECYDFFKYISNGEIKKVFIILNKIIANRVILYVYSSNISLFNDVSQLIKNKYYVILYKSTIGIASKEKYDLLCKYRSNDKKWYNFPKYNTIKYDINHNVNSKSQFVIGRSSITNSKKKMKLNNNLEDEIFDIYGWDMETLILDYNKDNQYHKYEPYCICLINKNNKEVVFWGRNCVIEFVAWLKNLSMKIPEKKKILFYSFNGARFDNVFIFKKILFAFFNNVKLIGKPTNIKEMLVNDNLLFYDLRLLLTSGSLNVLSANFLKKTKLDFNIMLYIKDEVLFNMVKDDIIKYCIQDCALVIELVLKLKEFTLKLFDEQQCLQKFNSFKWYQPTLSLLTLNIWKTLFTSECLVFGTEDQEIYLCEKDSYKGGMCLPIKKYSSHLFHYDITSSYPKVMRDSLLPTKYVKRIIRDKKNFSYSAYNCKDTYLYRVHYILKSSVKIPPFPQRIKYKDKLSGLIYTLSNEDNQYGDWIWGIELFQNADKIEKLLCYEIICYESKAIFQEYIHCLFTKRKEVKKTNESYAIFLKLLMNSLYGKFGQQKFGKNDVISYSSFNEYLENESKNNHDEDNNFMDSIKKIDVLEENGEEAILYIKYYPDSDLNFIGSCVRIASYITAVGRCNLMKAIDNVGEQNIYYFDTDSIFTSQKITNTDSVKCGVELGEWVCEEDDIIDGVFLNPKVYCYKCKSGKIVMKCKGIPSKLLDYSMYKNLDEFGKCKMDKINQIRINNDGIYWEENLTKILTVQDRKRIYEKNGDSKPFYNFTEMKNAIL